MLATACSFDANNLGPPKVKVQDAASDQPGAPDVPGAVYDGNGGWDDVGNEVRAEGQGDVSDLNLRADVHGPGDAPVPDDLMDGAGASGGLDGAGEDPGTGGMDGSGTGGSGGGTDGNATGGAGGMDVDAGNGIDGGTGGMGGNATGGTGGVGGTGGGGAGGSVGGAGGGGTGGGVGGAGGTGGVATGGTGGVDLDGGVIDAPGPDSGDDEAGVPSVDPDLVLWYRFDESSGTTAYDSAKFGGMARDATLATAGTGGSAMFSTVKQVGTHALNLAPSSSYYSGGGYVIIPTMHTVAPEAITIAVWLNLGAATLTQNWERVFDYADSTTSPNWFNLAARGGSSPYGPVFAMSNTGHTTADQQRLISSTAFPASGWHHIAVVLPAGTTYTGIMYIDGVVVATSSGMTLHLSDIGATANNWLGRSQFTTDPYFDGTMDDFRIYKRALLQSEIVALMALR
jgi:hypothetical protein